ncbi:MAG: hypothetical protein MHMPM18_000715 [Marteilia pararefringens]
MRNILLVSIIDSIYQFKDFDESGLFEIFYMMSPKAIGREFKKLCKEEIVHTAKTIIEAEKKNFGDDSILNPSKSLQYKVSKRL